MDSINYKKLYHLQDEVLKVVFKVENEFYLKVEVESKDFTRFLINDIAFRYKDVVVTPQYYPINNIENILSNKLTAIIDYTFLDNFEKEFPKIREEIIESLNNEEIQ